MHFIVMWEIYIQGEKWDEINQQLLDVMHGFNIVKVLKTSYVVKVMDQQDYARLHKMWSEVAEEHEGNIEFIMSPLMKAGQYSGYFRQEKWNALTSELGQGERPKA
jgi:hypothetical protein